MSKKHSLIKSIALWMLICIGFNANANEALFPEFHFSQSDLIKAEPSGEVKSYVRQGDYAEAYFGGVEGGNQGGMALKVVLDEDGQTVWFYNILASACSCAAWVKGTIEGDRIIVPEGQIMYFEDRVSYYTAYVLVNLSRNEECAPESFDAYDCIPGNIEFSYINGVIELMPNASGEASIGLMRYSTDSFIQEYGLNYKWLGYGDMNSHYSLFSDSAIEIPSNLPVQQYSFLYSTFPGDPKTGHLVDVMENEQYIYIKGMSNKLPNLWMRGTKEGDHIVWGDPLYIGQVHINYADHYVYQCSADVDSEGYISLAEKTIFDYNNEAGSWCTNGALIMNSGDTGINYADLWLEMVLAPYTYELLTPANPTFCGYYEYNADWNEGAFTVSVPCTSTDGKFINPEYLRFKVYINGTPLVFEPDKYFDIESTMTEIPYDFSSYFINQYAPGFWQIYFFGEEPSSIGVQAIYGKDDDTKESEIIYYNTSGIEQVILEPQIESVSYFTIDGRPTIESQKGLVIKTIRYSDGSIKSIKQINH